MTTDSNKILRPLPQRSWQLTPLSTSPDAPASPADPSNDEKLATQTTPSRTRSILNLTSSTLYGIYQSGVESVQDSVSNTPWGTGAMTPSSPSSPVFGEERRFSGLHQPPPTQLPGRKAFRKRKPVDFIGRSVLLFVAGMSYGLFISRMHDNPAITPVKVQGVNRSSWNYLISWGLVGAVAGNLLPWLETFLAEDDEDGDTAVNVSGNAGQAKSGSGGGQSSTREFNILSEWSKPLRGIGVFVGIAYAIRRLPWESSSQAALTLALVNPGLWFLMDRSKNGFLLYAILALIGTPLLLGINPDLIPQPHGGVYSNLTALERIQAHGYFSSETVGVFTWIASVVFCSAVCFHGIGKRLVGLQENV